MLACGLAVAKRQWRLLSNDRNGVQTYRNNEMKLAKRVSSRL